MIRNVSLSGAIALFLSALNAAAADLPPGLDRAELLPAYQTADGTWMTALRLDLSAGWKTYWRSPGDAGVPPGFDWAGSTNLASAALHWPRPEIIDSDGERTLGYHDELILPIELTPARPGEQVSGKVAIDLGLCLNICVPAHLELTTPAPAAAPDPRIATALALVPQQGADSVACTVTEIEDGLRVAASVPAPDGLDEAAALELATPDVWVSQPELTAEGNRITATADFVGPTGRPFALDPAALRLTLVGQGGAVEYQGCAPV